MRGFLFSAAVLCCICMGAQAQESESIEHIDSVLVAVSRAGEKTPVTFTTVRRDALGSAAPSKSLPMILGTQPSVVSTNEGGTGLGYSKLTIRGSKGSQINVTMNGITLNDSESQEVFWVNIPAISSYLSTVQVQRGLGTSANGAGAFGGSINMNSSFVSPNPSGSFDLSYGSYGTGIVNVAAGTGLTKKGFYANLAANFSHTDGYIRNAWADVYSFFGVVGRIKGRNSMKFTVLSGNQHTGITWEGIPAYKLAEDRTYNPAGEYTNDKGETVYYDNESDNYVQTHYQLNWSHRFNPSLVWSSTLNYTSGYGFYEQYKAGKKLSKYGMEGSGKADFITRKLMDNGYAVLNSTINYSRQGLDLAGGVYVARYDGNHFGRVLWNSANTTRDYEWYRNDAVKSEATAFAKAEYDLSSWLTGYLDLQYRFVGLNMKGIDDEFSELAYNTAWNFFNPRAGLTGKWGAHKAYLSFAVGHREPGRSDLKEQIESVNAAHAGEVTLRPERMYDTELGWEYGGKAATLGVNFYSMEYKDMLLETGKLSDSGYAIKENVDRSWRRGVELSGAWKPLYWLTLEGNLTLSTNKIKDYVCYEDTYDDATNWDNYRKTRIDCGTVDMLMSPSVIGMAGVVFTPLRKDDFRIGFTGKYVGKQYWDNTMTDALSIPAYYVVDCYAEKSFALFGGRLSLAAFCNNLLNRDYCADAWVYRAMFANGDAEYIEEGLFPQALRNFSVKIGFAF